MTNEPVAIFAALQTFIVAAVSFGEAFDWLALNDTQRAAVTGLWVAISGIGAFFVRSKVSPVVNTEAFGE